ncbi:MAG: hypothetical protein ACLTLQ_22340 [[Clostridium] scindens]
MMEPNFKVNMNEYLPLRDVVFNTLRQAILRGEAKNSGERNIGMSGNIISGELTHADQEAIRNLS